MPFALLAQFLDHARVAVGRGFDSLGRNKKGVQVFRRPPAGLVLCLGVGCGPLSLGEQSVKVSISLLGVDAAILDILRFGRDGSLRLLRACLDRIDAARVLRSRGKKGLKRLQSCGRLDFDLHCLVAGGLSVGVEVRGLCEHRLGRFHLLLKCR